VAGERILHVCYDSTLLIDRERLLLARGYDVVTVLGTDGALGLADTGPFALVVVGDGGPIEDRERAISWLKENFPATPVVALCRLHEHLTGADYQASTVDRKTWLSFVADCIERSDAV
jgi:DNA-binding response OmpR family regulator